LSAIHVYAKLLKQAGSKFSEQVSLADATALQSAVGYGEVGFKWGAANGIQYRGVGSSIAYSDMGGDLWCNTTPGAIDYWIKVTYLSGTGNFCEPGPFGSWTAFSAGASDYELFGTTGVPLYRSALYAVQIATDAAGSTVVASANYTCIAENVV